MVVDGTGESPSRLTSAVEGAEQRPIYHAAFDDVEYISAVPTCGSSGLTAGGIEPPKRRPQSPDRGAAPCSRS
jgi:hypothetical protein